MLRLATERLKPGMTLARDIYDNGGSLLLPADAVLDEQYIFRLASRGVEVVYVKDTLNDGSLGMARYRRTQALALLLSRQALTGLCRHHGHLWPGWSRTVYRIIGEALGKRDVLGHLSSLRLYDDYTFAHSVNVGVLAVLLGLKMYLSAKELVALAIGALLHDLGKTMIPRETLNKAAPLNAVEWQLIRRHGQWAFEVLRRWRSLPPAVAYIAFQHHENYDGSGYPLCLAGEEIHQYARIVAVADVFDAVTTDRPYRKAFSAEEACALILASRGDKFDPAVVDVFMADIAPWQGGRQATRIGACQQGGRAVAIHHRGRGLPLPIGLVGRLRGKNPLTVTDNLC